MPAKVAPPVAECISVGTCSICQTHHALRHGICPDCEEAKNNSPRGKKGGKA